MKTYINKIFCIHHEKYIHNDLLHILATFPIVKFSKHKKKNKNGRDTSIKPPSTKQKKKIEKADKSGNPALAGLKGY